MTLDLRRLTADYAVAPQIEPSDLPAIKAAGFVMVIDNRPDVEVGGALLSARMEEAAKAAGLAFVANPVIPGDFSLDLVTRQRAAIDAAGGPVLAYCASGNRSTVVWELVNAGRIPTDEMLQIAAQNGYSHEQFRPLIESFARG
jgi:uncharacterized protein (TIGR01244 family)